MARTATSTFGELHWSSIPGEAADTRPGRFVESRLTAHTHSPFPLAEFVPMRNARWLLAAAAVIAAGFFAATPTASAQDVKATRLLLVTDSGGFVHDSVGV